jgi:hypothetical protein
MAPYKNLIAISGACPLRIGIVALDPSQWATRFGQRSTVIMHSALHCRLRKTGEGGIRTLVLPSAFVSTSSPMKMDIEKYG